ncbi:inosine 5'-monophosphate dehydrogenase [Rubripirellula lacrimiformis]|uniref:Inosine 5'-monophosphate dehydrogenase n=1 Tax=Rubripirellula lacrimiformis TaxID=1930273 RepID=A0A517NJG2_9BACT|nr:CBS domain-containing protein [Rubripirellula lacrimiformis]QDT07279.1 inosine 5'-monophosphate dehydrogenase [Rubripirellula lacrimiformis]
MSRKSLQSQSVNDVYLRPVKDIMSSGVVTLPAGATVHEALTLMGENRVSALPIVNHQNECVGILSTSDLVDMTRDVDDDIYHLDMVDMGAKRFLLDKLAHSMGSETVQSFMSEVVTKVHLHTTISEALRQMLRNRVHHLPVVNEADAVMGIVSTLDILGEFADAAPDSIDD